MGLALNLIQTASSDYHDKHTHISHLTSHISHLTASVTFQIPRILELTSARLWSLSLSCVVRVLGGGGGGGDWGDHCSLVLLPPVSG